MSQPPKNGSPRKFFSAAGRASANGRTLPPAILGGRGERVLVVDNDPASGQTVAQTLERHDYRVVNCGDGLEALAVFETSPTDFAIVVTALGMPGLGGVELARALLQRRPDLRVLAMSELFQVEDGEAETSAIEDLAHAFLPKPVHPEDLLRIVRALLDTAADA